MRIGRKEYELKGLSCCCYGLETAGCRRQCPSFVVLNKVYVCRGDLLLCCAKRGDIYSIFREPPPSRLP